MDDFEYDEEEPRRGRSAVAFGLLLGLAAAAFLVAGIGAAWASHARGGGHGWGRGHDPRFAAEWVLRYVDATPEQEARALAILDATAPELEAFHARHHERRDAWIAALAGDGVDRAALEELRAAEIALADEGSQRLVAALADLAEVFTPAQRAELVDALARFHR